MPVLQDSRYGGLPNEPVQARYDEAEPRKYIIQQQAEAIAEEEARARGSSTSGYGYGASSSSMAGSASGRAGAYSRMPEMLASDLDTYVADGGALAGSREATTSSREALAGQRRGLAGGLGRGRSRAAVEQETSDGWM